MLHGLKAQIAFGLLHFSEHTNSKEKHHGKASRKEGPQKGRKAQPQDSWRIQVHGAQEVAPEAWVVLATPAQTPPQGAPPQQGGASSGASQGQVIQLISMITKASQALGQIFPASSPMVSAIQDQVQQIQSKVAETQRPQQPQAPPV